MSAEKILRLEQLTHAEKLRHWASLKPWAGTRLPREVTQVKIGRIFLERGKITKMQPLIGRPCFGQVTAVLRHGGHQPFWNARTRTMMNSRCMRCTVRPACEYVVDERLQVTPEIQQAHREWKRHGGREATWKSDGPTHAENCYRELLRLLTGTVQFSSVNDPIAVAYYEEILSDRRNKDQDRQCRRRLIDRLKRARAGEFDDEVIEVLHRHRIWRQFQHAAARQHEDGPRRLKQSPVNSSSFDAYVWLAKTRLTLQKKVPNDSNVAREMQSLGLELHRTHNALRDRVRRSLTRVALLERHQMPDRLEPVWPQFGSRELQEDLAFALPTSPRP